MKSFLIAGLSASIIFFSLPVSSLAAQGKTKPEVQQTPKVKAPPKKYTEDEIKKLDREAKLKIQRAGRNFYIQPVENTVGVYSILISDQEGKMITGEYRLSQIDILEAIMVEAGKFAVNAQGVGTSKPVITRFFDKQEPSFFVDVAKQGNDAQFFVTIKSVMGEITVDTGKIKRSTPEAKAFFHEMLKQIKEVKPKEGDQKNPQ
jgi:hypothetical protein